MIDLLIGLALAVGVVRFLRRSRGSWGGPLADVPPAPPDAVPLGRLSLNDDGLITHSYDLPTSAQD